MGQQNGAKRRENESDGELDEVKFITGSFCCHPVWLGMLKNWGEDWLFPKGVVRDCI